jgi:hypothetical protein
MSDNNSNPLKKYFRQPKIYIKLPSGGNFWPEGSIDMTETGELPVFAMTAKDEIMIKTPDALLNGQSTVDIIQSCIPNIKDAWKLPIIDLDTILVALRIASYGETMDFETKTPVTGTEQTFALDLRQILDGFIGQEFISTVDVNGMIIHLRPISYKEFTDTAIKTFEEQRIFRVLNDEKIPDGEKVRVFQESFKKLTEITVANLEKSIVSIEVDGEVVTNKTHIQEFVNNADKDLFRALTDHIDDQRKKFATKPLTVSSTPEDIEKGAPESFDVPLSFDSANFFGSGS